MAQDNKARVWFVEVNPKAECYEDITTTLQTLGASFVAFIKHEGDTTDQGEIKEAHYHAVIEFENARAFTSMRRKLPGAHLEVCANEKAALLYLTHETDQSTKDGKRVYSRSNVSTNDRARYESLITSTDLVEAFIGDYEHILGYIADGITDLVSFVKRFDLKAVKEWWKPYSLVLAERSNEQLRRDLGEVIKAREDDLPF